MTKQEQSDAEQPRLFCSPLTVMIVVGTSVLLMTLGPLGGWQMFVGQKLPAAAARAPSPALRTSAKPLVLRQTPRVGASIALHPPKFWAVGHLLSQWYNCPAAREAMSVFVIFWGEKDLELFRKGMAQRHPHVPADAWYGVVCDVPEVPGHRGGVSGQIISAWKKWYGITYMMDLGADAPIYGMMLDSELQLYNTSDCGPRSEWHRLYDRLAALEAAKLWPAAQVNDAASYKWGGQGQSGKEYDRILIEANARVIGAHPEQEKCKGLLTPGCREVKRQIDLVLFSWWTDLPYVNLKVAERMLPAIVSKQPKAIPRNESLGKWCLLAHSIFFDRFEHLAYQQWCVMHEGYHFDDVTAVTDYAVWGSYLEDPKPTKGYGSSRLAELHPMWLPSDANLAIQKGEVPPMSAVDPPLMYLHVDHQPWLYNCQPEIDAWGKFLEAEGVTTK